MSEWIKCSDRLPEQREFCWIYGSIHDPNDKFVFEGFYDKESCIIKDYRLSKEPGFEYNTEHSDYVALNQISHWMPYFTPEPPRDE